MEVEDSVAGEAEEVVVEFEVDRSRATQHPEAAAEVEMEPTKPGPGLGVGTGSGLVDLGYFPKLHKYMRVETFKKKK